MKTHAEDIRRILDKINTLFEYQNIVRAKGTRADDLTGTSSDADVSHWAQFAVKTSDANTSDEELQKAGAEYAKELKDSGDKAPKQPDKMWARKWNQSFLKGFRSVWTRGYHD